LDVNKNDANATILVSPETNTTAINALIGILSNGNSGLNDAALYFVGSNTDINAYGWNGVPLADQTSVMHPITSVGTQIDEFAPAVGNFSGIDVYEYYKLAWSAYAVVYTPDIINNMGTLTLYYDYQPWNGDTYLLQSDGTPTKHSIIMEDVSTFQFMSIGSIIKIQVCTKTTLTKSEDKYSLCKEKTIF
jgi:hypothetical protein